MAALLHQDRKGLVPPHPSSTFKWANRTAPLSSSTARPRPFPVLIYCPVLSCQRVSQWRGKKNQRHARTNHRGRHSSGRHGYQDNQEQQEEEIDRKKWISSVCRGAIVPGGRGGGRGVGGGGGVGTAGGAPPNGPASATDTFGRREPRGRSSLGRSERRTSKVLPARERRYTLGSIIGRSEWRTSKVLPAGERRYTLG